MSERRSSFERIGERAVQNLEAHEGRESTRNSEFEYVGAGGEHVVYRALRKIEGGKPRSRNMVVKANRKMLEEGLLHYVRDQTEGDSAHETLDQNLPEEILTRERAFNKSLRRYFPKEHLLRLHTKIAMVPVGQELARDLLDEHQMGDLSPSETIELPTIVRYQQEVDEEVFANGSGSFGTKYAERSVHDLSEYEQLNKMTLDEGSEFDVDLFNSTLHRETEQLLTLSKTDRGLRAAIEDFVRRSIRFTNQTQHSMDLIGAHNVQFYKTSEGKWSYVLLDVYAQSPWSDASETISKMGTGSHLGQSQTNRVMNALNYGRMLNGVARDFGMKERLNTFLDEHQRPVSLEGLSASIFTNIRHHYPPSQNSIDSGKDKEEVSQTVRDIPSGS
jgi:hypothetical protein